MDSNRSLKTNEESNLISWNLLPIEIWQRILRELTTKDKFKIRLVNKLLNKIFTWGDSWDEDETRTKGNAVILDFEQMIASNQYNALVKKLQKKQYDFLIKYENDLNEATQLHQSKGLNSQITPQSLHQETRDLHEELLEEKETSIFDCSKLLNSVLSVFFLGSLVSSGVAGGAYLYASTINSFGNDAATSCQPSQCEGWINPSLQNLMVGFFLTSACVGLLLKILDECLLAPKVKQKKLENFVSANPLKKYGQKILDHREPISFVLGGSLLGLILKFCYPRVDNIDNYMINGTLDREHLVSDVSTQGTRIISTSVADGLLLGYSLMWALVFICKLPATVKEGKYNCNQLFKERKYLPFNEKTPLIFTKKKSAGLN